MSIIIIIIIIIIIVIITLNKNQAKKWSIETVLCYKL